MDIECKLQPAKFYLHPELLSNVGTLILGLWCRLSVPILFFILQVVKRIAHGERKERGDKETHILRALEPAVVWMQECVDSVSIVVAEAFPTFEDPPEHLVHYRGPAVRTDPFHLALRMCSPLFIFPSSDSNATLLRVMAAEGEWLLLHSPLPPCPVVTYPQRSPC